MMTNRQTNGQPNGQTSNHTINLSASLLSMEVVAVTTDAVYLRLPKELQRDCGGCDCPLCRTNPNLAKWDTLVVPLVVDWRTYNDNHSYTVHMPDPEGFRRVIKLNGQDFKGVAR